MSPSSHSPQGFPSPPPFHRFSLWLLAAGCAGLTGAHAACSPEFYTTVAQWNAATLFNTVGVPDDADGRLQLVDPGDIRTFPTLWPANAGEDTVTKFDTNLNKEIGRYRTWFNVGIHGVFSGPAPSRTAVDGEGNVYVVNRHFDARPIFVMKILTSDAGAIDRNGNGVIDTATDLDNNGVVTGAEILPVLDDGSNGGIAGDGIPQIGEFRDERIRWVVQIPNSNNGLGRACAIDPDGNIWVGGYNSQAYWKLDSSTGAVLAGPIATPSMNPYGAVIDSAGMLWSASLGSALGQLDTNTGTWVLTRFAQRVNYGITLDNSRGRVYLGNGAPYTRFDTVTLAFSYPSAATDGLGISTTANGDILVHGSNAGFTNFTAGAQSGSFHGVTRFRPDDSVVWSSAAQAGGVDGNARGIAPDANGDVFTINLNTSNVSKYRGTTGAHLGVFPIGTLPYSYSDLSGSSFLQTNLIGTWIAEHSDLLRGNKDSIVRWTGDGPGAIKVELAGSNAPGLPGPFVETTNGAVVPGVAGKYLTVRVTLQASGQQSPSISELSVDSCPQIGDFDGDCSVDMDDYVLIRTAYAARSTDLRWDVNGDGIFNIADLRRLVLLFCNPGGAKTTSRTL